MKVMKIINDSVRRLVNITRKNYVLRRRLLQHCVRELKNSKERTKVCKSVSLQLLKRRANVSKRVRNV